MRWVTRTNLEGLPSVVARELCWTIKVCTTCRRLRFTAGLTCSGDKASRRPPFFLITSSIPMDTAPRARADGLSILPYRASRPWTASLDASVSPWGIFTRTSKRPSRCDQPDRPRQLQIGESPAWGMEMLSPVSCLCRRRCRILRFDRQRVSDFLHL